MDFQRCRCPQCGSSRAIVSRRETVSLTFAPTMEISGIRCESSITTAATVTEHVYCRICRFSALEDVDMFGGTRESYLCYTED